MLKYQDVNLAELTVLSTNKGGEFFASNNIFISNVKSYEDTYYEKIFTSMLNNKVLSWNSSAFFGGSSWFYYRKMYLNAFIYLNLLLIFIFLSLISIAHSSNIEFTFFCIFLSFLVIRIALGIFGNYLYYRSLRNKIKKGYHNLKYLNNIDQLSSFLVFFCPILAPIIGPIIAISDRLRVSKYHKEKSLRREKGTYSNK